jgi:putative membrane protein
VFSHDGGMICGGVFMWIFWLILLVLVLLVIRAAVGSISTGSGGTSQSTGESPLEILKKRCARGEVDEEEFKRRRRELEQ